MEHLLKLSAPPFHVQSSAKQLRSGFPYFEHHESVSRLWASKWRQPCAHGIYPFTDGDVADFDPIFAELVRLSGDDPAILYRPDDYARPFLPVGDRLAAQAADALSGSRVEEARSLFLRAAAVFRIARFPINRSELGQEAWRRGKDAYERGGELLDPPSIAVSMPFSQRNGEAGDASAEVQAYLRVPSGDRPKAGWPVLLFICGLDAYRTDHTPRTQEHVNRGFATLSFEIPGTGDCPAAPNDPTSPDRLMSSVIDWVISKAPQFRFDTQKIIARGISTGGYYAFRAAHTHADQLFAVVAQGGGCHHMFDPEWIAAQDQMEYPFALAEALAWKFGYRHSDDAVAVVRYAAEANKFSLLGEGLMKGPTCRMLAINGMEDSIFPIEDSLLAAITGNNKDLIVRGDRPHMGNPGAEEILYDWIDDVMKGKP